MNKTAVWKYQLTEAINEIDLPQDAEVLSSAVQNGVVCIWCKVNPDAKLETRKFLLITTGASFSDFCGDADVDFINTIFDDWFVYHIFEIDKEKG